MFVGCEKKSDDDVYTTCKIVHSTAMIEANKLKDESQCWTGGTYSDKSSAFTWCTNKADDYCNDEYTFCTQSFTIEVSNGGC